VLPGAPTLPPCDEHEQRRVSPSSQMLALAAAVPPGHGVNRTSTVQVVELKDSIVDDQVGVTRG